MKLAWDQYAPDARYTPQPGVPEFATRSDTCMESDSGKRAKESSVRYPAVFGPLSFRS